MNLIGNMEVKNNELFIGGVGAKSLVEKYSTPLYVFDEDLIRENCRKYYKSFKVKENGNRVSYAGKAFLTLAMCKLVNEEGLNLDVVSGGELYTAYKSGYPTEKIYFHSNNKTIDEINMGIDLGVGYFVADNIYEVEKINEISASKGKIQKILLRITPGIEAHTHEYIKTGQLDSKFGFPLIGDIVINTVKKVKEFSNVKLVGIHCHIGSQIFDIDPYKDAVDIMLNLSNDIRNITGVELEQIDIGGGFGIYYTDEDKPKSFEEYCDAILSRAEEKCKELNIKMPIFIIEPGRSIVGNAGSTLYTVGSIKDIPDMRKYIAIDGGMTDNIRPALYNAEYECALANRVYEDDTEKVTIAGKCCESGDILINDVTLPKVKSGDVLAIFTTGAYGYSMSNNYNKIPKPAVVMVKDGQSKLVCRRESYEDLIRNEM
jgi:diaminopimelate decarboxylase